MAINAMFAAVALAIRPVEYEDFNAATYTGKTGRIVIPHKAEATISRYYINQSNAAIHVVRLNSTNGCFVAPVGKTSWYISLTKDDPDGTKWSAGASVSSNDMEVKEDQVLNLDVGQSLKASIEVKPGTDGLVSMSLKVVDQTKRLFSISDNTPNQTKFKPGLQVLDLAGKVIWERALEFS